MGLWPTDGDENSRRNRSLMVAAGQVAATRYRAATVRERSFSGVVSENCVPLAAGANVADV